MVGFRVKHENRDFSRLFRRQLAEGNVLSSQWHRFLDADIITTDTEAVEKIAPGPPGNKFGKDPPFPPLKQISASFFFYFADFSQKYDFFIFSGNWAHFAAHHHHPNMW